MKVLRFAGFFAALVLLISLVGKTASADDSSPSTMPATAPAQ